MPDPVWLDTSNIYSNNKFLSILLILKVLALNWESVCFGVPVLDFVISDFVSQQILLQWGSGANVLIIIILFHFITITSIKICLMPLLFQCTLFIISVYSSWTSGIWIWLPFGFTREFMFEAVCKQDSVIAKIAAMATMTLSTLTKKVPVWQLGWWWPWHGGFTSVHIIVSSTGQKCKESSQAVMMIIRFYILLKRIHPPLPPTSLSWPSSSFSPCPIHHPCCQTLMPVNKLVSATVQFWQGRRHRCICQPASSAPSQERFLTKTHQV